MFGEAVRPLLKHLDLKTQGQWKAKNIFETIVGCCIQRKSIHSLQSVAKIIPAETSMWHHLEKLKMEDILAVSSDILVEPIMEMLNKSKKYTFAIDFTNDSYYGKIVEENQGYVIGGRTKKSSRKFYIYASLYLIDKNFKVTVAVMPVQDGVPFQAYIEYFLGILKQYELNAEVLLLDKEFYDTGIIKCLMNEKIPHIMPVKRHGKELKKLINRPKSGCDTYTFKKSKVGHLAIDLAIYNKNLNGEMGEHGRKTLAYVKYGIDWKPRKIANSYRKRFGIEASYRMRNIVRPKTSSRNPTFRYLLMLISLLLKNVWEALKWKFFRRFKRWSPTVDEDAFRFETFITNLTQAFLRKTGLKAIRSLRWPER